MTDKEKQETLAKRREAYKLKKESMARANADELHCITFRGDQPGSLHTAHSEQEDPAVDPKVIQEKHTRERMRYRNMELNKKQVVIERIKDKRASRRNNPSKYSIAMENPGYITTDMSPPVPTRSPKKMCNAWRKTCIDGTSQRKLHADGEVIFDDDTDEESDMLDDQGWEEDQDIQIIDVVDAITESPSIPDLDKIVYSNLPQSTHMLKPMYHNIRSFGTDGSNPKRLELYFYDDDPTLEHRYRHCRPDLYEQDQKVISTITNILRGNPYSEQFRSLGQAENLEDYRVILNLDQWLDQRTYNAPITSEVAAVWVEGNERRKTFDKSDGYELRKHFLVELLAYQENECESSAEAPDLVIATATTKQERASSRGDPRSSDYRCKALDPDERLVGSRSGRETDRKYTTVAESNPCRCRGHSTPSTARAALWPRCMTRCRHEVKMGSQQGEKELGDGGLGDQQAWHGRTRRYARGGRWWEGIGGNRST
ncbi:hypothetical protein OsJ_06453 [Oryza sativa Japonica Group]|uniref:Uncharacterized protein n=1 Tax=Oryza sativa subsp. japonica TaxID=39947 RepID=B9F5B2_ORYSJ|nr:hypothetical protein OsJ_06453 [Oryza sativa Japonica Group]